MPLQGEEAPYPGPLGPQFGPTPPSMPLQGEEAPYPGPLGPQFGPSAAVDAVAG